MTEVHKGEVVRVVGSSSEWQGSRGMVIEVIDRKHSDGDDKVQECAIEFGGERRWFMVEHLVKVVPTNMVRFFRAEAIERWHLDTDRANDLDGRRDQLIVSCKMSGVFQSAARQPKPMNSFARWMRRFDVRHRC